MAGVSVRTLHHYDDIGLLQPSGRSRAGYRLYTAVDLERLQEILLLRRMGLALEEVGAALRANAGDRRALLRRQREALLAKVDELRGVVALVDRSLQALEGAIAMSDEALFDGLSPMEWNEREHGAEVRERWGDTDGYRESTRRASQYRQEDWDVILAEGRAVETELGAALAAGVPADDPRAMDLAERARLHIDRWFYPCSHEMHAGLGDMYVADERFTAHYEQVQPGLAAYLRDAILANGLRAVEAGQPG